MLKKDGLYFLFFFFLVHYTDNRIWKCTEKTFGIFHGFYLPVEKDGPNGLVSTACGDVLPYQTVMHPISG